MLLSLTRCWRVFWNEILANCQASDVALQKRRGSERSSMFSVFDVKGLLHITDNDLVPSSCSGKCLCCVTRLVDILALRNDWLRNSRSNALLADVVGQKRKYMAKQLLLDPRSNQVFRASLWNNQRRFQKGTLLKSKNPQLSEPIAVHVTTPPRDTSAPTRQSKESSQWWCELSWTMLTWQIRYAAKFDPHFFEIWSVS